jgi:hypothetical protein
MRSRIIGPQESLVPINLSKQRQNIYSPPPRTAVMYKPPPLMMYELFRKETPHKAVNPRYRSTDQVRTFSHMPKPTKYIFTWSTTVYVPSSELEPPPTPSPASDCVAPPGTKGRGTHSPAGEGVGYPDSDDWCPNPKKVHQMEVETGRRLVVTKRFPSYYYLRCVVSAAGSCVKGEVVLLCM